MQIRTTLPERYCALDTETTGLYRHAGHRPFAASVVFPNKDEFFFRWDPATMREVEGSDELGKLERMVEDPHLDKVFHNRKFDEGMLDSCGFLLQGMGWDTGILVHLLDGRDAQGGLNLDSAVRKYLPAQYRKISDPIKDWFKAHKIPKAAWDFQLLPHELLRSRCVIDTEITLKLFERLYPTVAYTFPYLLEMEHRLIPVVKRMEDRGICVDEKEIEVQTEYLESIIEDVHDFACGVLDWPVWNLNSPKDCRALLEEAGIYESIDEWTKPAKNRKSKKPFVPQRSMAWRPLLALHHPVAHMMLVAKAAGKMISPFLSQARDLSVDGVIHPSYKPTGTVSGRFSCADPNLQNVPVEGERKAQYTEDEAEEVFESTGYNVGQHIKRVFLVRPGYCHIHMDKKQAEMFALGHYSKDQVLVDILLTGESVHDGMCTRLFGEITKGLKQRSKAVTFGYQYGAGLATIAKRIKGNLREARAIRDRLAQTFHGLPRWRKELEEQIRTRGYVETDHGRRHYLYKTDAYMGVNRVCQGHVGDELKGRMVAIGEWLHASVYDARILLNIHDELVIECLLEDLADVAPKAYDLMLESDIEHEVAIPSDMEITYTRWSDLETVENPHDPSTYPKPPAVAGSY